MKVRRIPLVLLLAALAAPTAIPVSSASSLDAARGLSGAPTVATLVDVRAAHHPGFDRIVFEFNGGLPASHHVQYVDELTADGSGRPVRIAGRAVLRTTFGQADAHNADGATAPARAAFGLPNILTAVRAGDFEAVTTYGIGLAKKTPFRVSTLEHPGRVVIDIDAGFRTVQRKVFLLNLDNYVEGRQPFFTPVPRPVRAATPGVGVLDSLFAGPTASERRDGLRLLRSRAAGFTGLSISDGIARVRLTKKCSSNGSTVTVAGEIMPTLRQFDSVDWVKIYGPAGVTQTPYGHSDSVPTCLEP